MGKDIIKTSKKEILLKIFISILLKAETLILPVFWAKVITNVTNLDFDSARNNVLICLTIIIVYWLSEYTNQKFFYKLYTKIYLNLTKKAINGISHNSLFSLSRFSLSEYLNILNNDIDVIASYYTSLIVRLLSFLEIFAIYYYFFNVNVYMFLIAFAVSIIGIVAFGLLRKKTSRNNSERKENLDIKTSYNHEFFSGMRDIKAFNLFDKISNRIFRGTDTYLKSNTKYNVAFNGDKYLIVGLIDITRYLMMFYGVYLIAAGKMDIGILVVIYNYFGKMVDNFGVVSTLNVERCNLEVSCERYNKIFEHVDYSGETETKNYDFVGRIEFHNVLYGYKDDPTLKDFNLVIEPNSLTTIIGKDGSGYNGIYELLLKMNRQHYGTVTLDDYDIKSIDNKTYYSTFALVSSNPFFFNLSIKENLSIVNSNKEEITKVCSELGIDKLIQSLPRGYDTIINDEMSHELRSMLAFARVFLKKTKVILIADLLFELDEHNFNLVLKYLRRMSANHTIVILGRELDTCDVSDKVAVLDDATLKEIGTHQELIDNKGFYYNNFYNYENKDEE